MTRGGTGRARITVGEREFRALRARGRDLFGRNAFGTVVWILRETGSTGEADASARSTLTASNLASYKRWSASYKTQRASAHTFTVTSGSLEETVCAFGTLCPIVRLDKAIITLAIAI